MSKFKVAFIVSLCVLTFTVVAYDYQFYNIPVEMYIHASYAVDGEIIRNYTDCTGDVEFRTYVFDYVRMSASVGESIRIFDYNPAKGWFKQVYDSSPHHSICVKYGDDFYWIKVRYQKAYNPSLLEEYGIILSANLSTIALWVVLAVEFETSPKLKGERKK